MAQNQNQPYDHSAKAQSVIEYLQVLSSPPRDPHKIEADRQKEQEQQQGDKS